MIVSSPKTKTIFSLLTFLLITYGLLIYLIIDLIKNPVNNFKYILVFGLIPMVVIVSYRTFKSLKIYSFGEGRMEVNYLLNMGRKTIFLRDMHSWSETVISNKLVNFKELRILLNNEKKPITLNSQENTSYTQVFTYFQKKYPFKRK